MKLDGWEWIIILVIVLLFWGAPKLPGLAKSLAQSMKVFKKEIKNPEDAAKADKPAEDTSSEK
jgi:sec-independent protein translocase protein TatA